MPLSQKETVIGCYEAEAMGFKIATSKAGSKYCCLEAVLQNYGEIPQDVTILFNLYKRDKSPNTYAEKDINKLGRCVGSKQLAEWKWNDNEIRLPLQGAKLRIDYDDEGFFRRVSFAPMRDYPSFNAVAGDDIDMGDTAQQEAETIIGQAIGQDAPKKVTLEPLMFEAGSEQCPF